jgi:hypothetical protein
MVFNKTKEVLTCEDDFQDQLKKSQVKGNVSVVETSWSQVDHSPHWLVKILVLLFCVTHLMPLVLLRGIFGGGITTLVKRLIRFEEWKLLKEMRARKRFAKMHSKARIKFKNRKAKKVGKGAWRCPFGINLLWSKLKSCFQKVLIKSLMKVVQGFLFVTLFSFCSILFPIIKVFHLVKCFVSLLVRCTWGLGKLFILLVFPLLFPWIFPLAIWHTILMKYGKLSEPKHKEGPSSWSTWVVEKFHNFLVVFKQVVFYGVIFLALLLSPSFYGIFLVNILLELLYIFFKV